MTTDDFSNVASLLGWISGLNGADLVGMLGVLIYVSAYFCLQIGLLKGDGYSFPLLNLVASACILISLSQDFNAYSATVEIAWSVISIIGLTRLYLIHRLIRLNEEESMVVGILIHRLTKDRARKFLKLGHFEDAPAGTILAEEGKPIQYFTVMLGGRCRIERGGTEVATLGAGALVGELTYATGAPATASVFVDVPSRLFRIDCETLRQFLANNLDVAMEMELNSALDIRAKLSATTMKLSGLQPAASTKGDV